MSDFAESQRRFQRVQLDVSGESEEQQSSGLAVQLYNKGFFGKLICLGVLKDISEGGAGVLIPRHQPINDDVVIQLGKKFKLDVDVCYRRTISQRLEFIGFRWRGLSARQISQVVKLIEKLGKNKTVIVKEHTIGKEVANEE